MALKRGRKVVKEAATRISDEVRKTLNSKKIELKPQFQKKKKYVKSVAFYNEDFDFLENLQLVRAFYKRKHGIDIRELELILALYPKNYFTQLDYFIIPKPFTYNRILKMVKLGHVVLFAKGKTKTMDVYTMTGSTRSLVRNFYRYLSGEKRMPEDSVNNPMAKKSATVIDQLRMDVIKKMNQLEPSKHKKSMYE